MFLAQVKRSPPCKQGATPRRPKAQGNAQEMQGLRLTAFRGQRLLRRKTTDACGTSLPLRSDR